MVLKEVGKSVYPNVSLAVNMNVKAMALKDPI
jgi:hypothetical protein